MNGIGLDQGRKGKAIREKYEALGDLTTRVKLQIDSAGGHCTARGYGNFDELAAMMLADFNIELVQQPGNSPMFNIFDLTIWRTTPSACHQDEHRSAPTGGQPREDGQEGVDPATRNKDPGGV